MEAALWAAFCQVVAAVSAPPAPSEDRRGRDPGPKDPLPSPLLPSLPSFVTLASPWFTLSRFPWKLWIPFWAGFISARGLVELGWNHWPAGGMDLSLGGEAGVG